MKALVGIFKNPVSPGVWGEELTKIERRPIKKRREMEREGGGECVGKYWGINSTKLCCVLYEYTTMNPIYMYNYNAPTKIIIINKIK